MAPAAARWITTPPRLSRAAALLAALSVQFSLLACGPDFPNYLLLDGDRAVLGGATVCFASELERMHLIASKHQAAQAQGSFPQESRDAELKDLTLALKNAKVAPEDAAQLISAHAAARAQLMTFLSELDAWESSRPWIQEGGEGHRGEAPTPRPKFPLIPIIPGLPDEFADYFEGALAWHNPELADKTLARQCWERLLARPESDRKFKSVWAAFMLAKSWEKEDTEKATNYFAQVRALTARKFVDSVGLAAASLGLEARVQLHEKHFIPAIDLYLEQMAAGDPTAVDSLRCVATEALQASPETLQKLARHPRAQRVLTAFVLSHRLSPAPANPDFPDGEPSADLDMARKWLTAIEAAGVTDADSAEKLALVAYQVNEMKLAERWIKLARGAPVAQWIQAKLWLRAGKLNQAAAAFARVAPLFPVEPRQTNAPAPVLFKDTLSGGLCWGGVSIERQVLAEWGVLRLARCEFVLALDALLNAGFWMDAAYIAERVLTLDELKNYVDQSWPPATPGQVAEEREKYDGDAINPAALREKIRYLLARRLTRASRSDEARSYYPEAWVPQLEAFVQALTSGWDESLPAEQRAHALFAAAIITRTNGMELIGTEVEPDWHIHAGDFEEGVTLAARATNDLAKVLAASQDELRRAAQHRADPDTRFHYRYQAASLAWEAAKLLPDNSDLTAYILWRAGTWLKYQDPPTADIFYKALVRRNRRTALGAEADRRRWFPVLDADGNIIPRRPAEPSVAPPEPTVLIPEEAPPESPGMDDAPVPPDALVPEQVEPGFANAPADFGVTLEAAPYKSVYEYVVQTGDTLPGIVQTLTQAGIAVRFEDLLRANPGPNPARLKVGQILYIPVPQANE